MSFYRSFVRSGRLFATVFAVLLIPMAAHAYKVKPLITTLDPAGENANMSITIENTHTYPLALEMSVSMSEINPDGSETKVDATDSFIVFPPQAIVKPGKVQKVSVRYIGGVPNESKIYRVHIEPLPVASESEGKRVGFSFAFHPVIYVVPQDAVFDIAVSEIKPVSAGYDVTVSNSGNRHAVLMTGEWVATDDSGKTVALDPELVSRLQNPIIAAGQTRTLTLPTSLFSEIGTLSSLTIRPER